MQLNEIESKYISEAFLYYVWQYYLYNHHSIKTTQNQSVQVLHSGTRNSHSGPDFANAKIKIDETIWAGNVEIHVKSSDWNKHKHQFDQAYKSVIAHVVYIHDTNDNSIPTIEIKNILDDEVFYKYITLMQTQSFIPCENQVQKIESFVKNTFVERLCIERLESKSQDINQLLIEFQNHWETVFYITLFKTFGTNVNALPFELMARKIPLNLFAKHKQNPKQIEALLFGVAGFLADDTDDAYHSELKKEFDFLQAKYNITPLHKSIWKQGGVRIGNFPSQRLAQLSALITASSHLFSKVIESTSDTILKSYFEIPMNTYWQQHYDFGKVISRNNSSTLSKNFIHHLLINAVIPTIIAYSNFNQNEQLREKALDLLQKIPKEKNRILQHFEHYQFTHTNAMQSQGILQLYKQYCTKKRCLACAIGNQLLRAKS